MSRSGGRADKRCISSEEVEAEKKLSLPLIDFSQCYYPQTRSMSKPNILKFDWACGTFIICLPLEDCMVFRADTRCMSKESNFRETVKEYFEAGIKREALICKIYVVGRCTIAICGVIGFGEELVRMMSRKIDLNDTGEDIERKLTDCMGKLRTRMPALSHVSGAIVGYFDYSLGFPRSVLFQCGTGDWSVRPVELSFGGSSYDKIGEFLSIHYRKNMEREAAEKLANKCVCLASGTSEKFGGGVGGSICGAVLTNGKDAGQCSITNCGQILPLYFD